MSGRSVDLEAASEAIEAFLRAIGVPVESEPELALTGRRVAAAFSGELLEGYAMRPDHILSDATKAEGSDLVILRDVTVAPVCPHHLLPSLGVVQVGYIPGAKVVGIGALGRLVDCFARRLILQEALGRQIVEALLEHAGAKGAACVIDLRPGCVAARGQRRHATRSVTSAFAGCFEQDVHLRTEFLQLLTTRQPSI